VLISKARANLKAAYDIILVEMHRLEPSSDNFISNSAQNKVKYYK